VAPERLPLRCLKTIRRAIPGYTAILVQGREVIPANVEEVEFEACAQPCLAVAICLDSFVARSFVLALSVRMTNAVSSATLSPTKR
jgi:hypothetical protein